MRSGLVYAKNPAKHAGDPFDINSNIEKRNKIASNIVGYYSKHSDTLGILLVGSLQGKPRDKFSDFDFFIIYKDKAPSIDERKAFIKILVGSKFVYGLDYVSKEYGISDIFDWDDIEVCISFYSMNEAQQFIFDLKKNKDYKRKGFYYPMAFSAAVADGVILFEEEESISSLKIQ